MTVTVETGTTLEFDRFWRWLKHHANCILRAGTVDTFLYDQEAFHWHLEEDSDRNPVIQLVWGKVLVAEMILDPRDVLYVEARPDGAGEAPGAEEEDEEDQYVFEVIGGSREEPYAVYHVVMAHAFEEEATHAPALKH